MLASFPVRSVPHRLPASSPGAPGQGAAQEPVQGRLLLQLRAFRTLGERTLSLRAETIAYGNQILDKLARKSPITGDDIALLNHGIHEHLALRGDLMQVVEAHEDWMKLSSKEMALRNLSPEDRLHGVMLSLGSALLLYDNYLLAVSLFEGSGKLRRMLNERDSGYAVTRSALAKVSLTYNSTRNRAKVRKAIRFYEKESQRLGNGLARTPELEYLHMVIAQSPSYSMLNDHSSLWLVGRKLGFFSAATTDSIQAVERGGVSLFSMVFGNSVGLVETRKGKLFNQVEVLTDVTQTLRASDVLLEKTPFRLTDKLIPGYWGHAAIWVGTEAELKDLGIWTHPVVVMHHEKIRQGRLVVEALRSGVEMNPLQRFLNIDSLGVLRQPGLDREARGNIVLQALRQVGKRYDFNFDVESKDRVYCSKLVYLAYGGIDWPTKKSMGRTTFTPDDVASKATKEHELQIVTFYHDGHLVREAPALRMAELLGKAGK